MKVGIANDHVGYDLKILIIAHLDAAGHEVVDYGTGSTERTDYPTWGRILGEAVSAGRVERGIVVCGSGVGISIAANKVAGIRAVCCSEPYSAMVSRQHNDTNVLAFGSRVVGEGMATMIVDAWLNAEYEGGRHDARIHQIAGIELSPASLGRDPSNE